MRTLFLLAFAVTTGCSCAPATPTDAGSADAPIGPGVDGGGADAGTPDAATCAEPASGTEAFAASCGATSSGGFATQVAILLQPGGGARMRIVGRVPGARTSCDRWDTIDVFREGAMIATLPAGGAVVSTLGDGVTPWAEGAVDPSVAALCSDDTGRFDSVTLTVHARTDGGTLTLTCGGGSGFPPSVVLTCHSGIDPALPDTYIHHSTSDDRTSLQAWFPDATGAEVTSIDGTIRFLRGSAPFGPTLAPVGTSGWTFSAWSRQPSPPLAFLLAGAAGSPLGADCPATPITPPDFPPVLIAQITGTTSAGPFTTELYSEGCFSGP